jgi:hypothetical protein
MPMAAHHHEIEGPRQHFRQRPAPAGEGTVGGDENQEDKEIEIR